MIYRYIGAGEHWEGVPARDLDAAAFDALAPAQQGLVGNGALYRQEAEAEPADPGTGEADRAPAPEGWPTAAVATGEFALPQQGSN